MHQGQCRDYGKMIYRVVDCVKDFVGHSEVNMDEVNGLVMIGQHGESLLRLVGVRGD